MRDGLGPSSSGAVAIAALASNPKAMNAETVAVPSRLAEDRGRDKRRQRGNGKHGHSEDRGSCNPVSCSWQGMQTRRSPARRA
jgi:hypothetical protein